jgi:hypothetical protein
MKKFAASIALLMSVACASAPMNTNASGSASTAASGLTRSQATSYVALAQPNQVRDLNWDDNLRALHVRGIMTSNGFMPLGNVEGNGATCADGKDWLSFSELTVHKASEGKTPVAPYVYGCATATGFQPASRDIVR